MSEWFNTGVNMAVGVLAFIGTVLAVIAVIYAVVIVITVAFLACGEGFMKIVNRIKEL